MAYCRDSFMMRRDVSFADLPRWLRKTHCLKRTDGRLWWDPNVRCWKVGTPSGVRRVLYGDVIAMDYLGNLILEKVEML